MDADVAILATVGHLQLLIFGTMLLYAQHSVVLNNEDSFI